MKILSKCLRVIKGNEYIRAFLLIGIISIPYFLVLTDMPEVHSDAKEYILIAKSILKKEAYPEDPTGRFPFIFPLILVPILYLFGYNFLIMKLVVTILAFVAIYFTYLLLKEALNESCALLFMFLIGISSTLLEFTMETADVSFLLFSIIAIVYVNRYHNDERVLSRHLFLSGFFILAAFFTRVAGIALCVAAVLYLLFEAFNEKADNMGKAFLKVATISVVITIPIAIWVYLHRDVLVKEYIYAYTLRNRTCLELGFYRWKELLKKEVELFPNGVTNLWRTLFIGERFLSNIHQIIAMVFKWSTFLVFILGLMLHLFRRRTLVEYYTICNLAMLLLLYKSVPRQYLPILPFIIYYFIEGVRAIIGKLFILRTQRVIFVLIIAIIVLSNLIVDVQLIRLKHSQAYQDNWQDYLNAIEWISANTPKDSVIMAFHPAWVSVFSDRRAIGYPWVSEHKYIYDSIYKNRVNYILVDSFAKLTETKRFLIPAIEARSDEFDLVYTINQAKVYKVNPAPLKKVRGKIELNPPNVISCRSNGGLNLLDNFY